MEPSELEENQKKGKLLLIVGTIFLIGSLFIYVFFIIGFIILGSGLIIYLTNRK